MPRVSPSMIQQNKDWNWTTLWDNPCRFSLPEHDPTEQGLKRQILIYDCRTDQLPEHDPTEQGLKHPYSITPGDEVEISPSMIQQNKDWNKGETDSLPKVTHLPEHDPTEQGLKHPGFFCFLFS